MKILALNCSPLGSKGRTMLILEPFLQGMHEAGGEVELFHLASLNIYNCRGKLECWFKTPGKCILIDDMELILERMKKADVWVFATGVYWDGITGLMKNVMDRMLPLVEPSIKLLNGRCHNPLREGVKKGKVVLISSCGHWSMDNFDQIISHMKNFSDKCERQFAGALLRPHIFALPHMMWLGKETTHIHNAATEAGKEFFKTGKIQQKHLDVVSSELMPLQTYIRHMNQVYNKVLSISTEEKRSVIGDKLSLKTIPHIVTLVAGADKDLCNKIMETINRMGGIGDRADEEYQNSLNILRSVAKKATPVIVRVYEELPEEHYLDRWSLVYLLGEIRDPESLSFLEKLLLTKIPPEESKLLHQYSTKGEELIIRTSAIEAIKKIAGLKDKRAIDLLLKQVEHEIFSVRRAAVQGYLEIGGNDAQAQLERILPKKEHNLLKIKRKDVRDIPQAIILDCTGKIKTPLGPVPPREDERDKVAYKKKDEVPESLKKDKGDSPSGRSF